MTKLQHEQQNPPGDYENTTPHSGLATIISYMKTTPTNVCNISTSEKIKFLVTERRILDKPLAKALGMTATSTKHLQKAYYPRMLNFRSLPSNPVDKKAHRCARYLHQCTNPKHLPPFRPGSVPRDSLKKVHRCFIVKNCKS